MPEKGLSAMVSYLVMSGCLKSASVRKAMLSVDRLFFVPQSLSGSAYSDDALPVAYGQTISAPTVVAFMLERLDVRPGMNVLEVGTGSGYNCALLAELVGPRGKVVSIDIVPELVALAESNIKKAGKERNNVELVAGDGSLGYEKGAPYDRIIVTAGMPWFDSTHPLAKQLKPDGKLIAPVGSRFFQDLIVYDKKTGKGESVLPVMFVPLLGEYGFGKAEND